MLIKTGLVGTLLTALCCFTPLLVWLFAAVGLSAWTGVLDVVLLSLLGVFMLLLLIGIVRRTNRNKTR